MSEGAVVMQPQGASPPQARHLPVEPSLDLSSRADSEDSGLSQGSQASGYAEQGAGTAQSLHAGSSCGSELESGGGSLPLDHSDGQGGASSQTPPKKEDAKSSALKALAGVSAIVSKSRKVDAEALQTIKLQRAKARAEGGASLSTASSAAAPLPAHPTPPPADGATVSPFATATSQGLVRSPSATNIAPLHGAAATLTQATSLPANISSRHHNRRASPTSTPPSDYDAMVSKMTITELVALKQAVEGQLAKQALALVQLQASSSSAAAAQQQADMLSQQYAALLLQNAQQAQLVQQLSAQQQAATASAIQQALAAAAHSAGITTPSFSPEQLMLSAGAGAGGSGGAAAALTQYSSMPLTGDMATPFACAPFPSEPAFGIGDAARGNSLALSVGVSKSSGSHSPRSTSTEQHLIGEALHSFLDPERQGPPSRQGSSLVPGLGWGDRRTSGALPPSALGAGAGGAPPPSFPARSRSLPPQDLRFAERAASLSTYLGEGEQLPTLFSTLRLSEPQLPQQEAPAPPPSAFAVPAARSASLQLPLARGGGGALGTGGHLGQPHVSFSDTVHLHPSYGR